MVCDLTGVPEKTRTLCDRLLPHFHHSGRSANPLVNSVEDYFLAGEKSGLKVTGYYLTPSLYWGFHAVPKKLMSTDSFSKESGIGITTALYVSHYKDQRVIPALKCDVDSVMHLRGNHIDPGRCASRNRAPPERSPADAAARPA